jgi:hypothetical protein
LRAAQVTTRMVQIMFHNGSSAQRRPPNKKSRRDSACRGEQILKLGAIPHSTFARALHIERQI